MCECVPIVTVDQSMHMHAYGELKVTLFYVLCYYSSDVIAMCECKVAMDIAVGDLLVPRNQLNLYRAIASRRLRMTR